ncbi:MAG: YjzC family protein [Brevundimonas sp.]|uniref:YjzC family protein n=1 Tax=Brevundimonas sp. TaxID=1871086 RepID=UPI00258622CD|nr:YjzC family protein [Brevundimonas sp.]MCV0414124.1 YjzC family protein [Brevundimonas sp.]
MANQKPGSNTGRNGGIFQEIGPRGGARPNYTTVPDNHRLPPTTSPGATWKPTHRTPNSDR